MAQRNGIRVPNIGHSPRTRDITNSGGGNLKTIASTPFLYFVFAMAKLRAGVHEVARGRVGCKLGITPLNQMGLGVGGTHDIRGGRAVVAAIGGGPRLAVGVGGTS